MRRPSANKRKGGKIPFEYQVTTLPAACGDGTASPLSAGTTLNGSGIRVMQGCWTVTLETANPVPKGSDFEN
jgi:hypothetical protein